MKNWGQSKRTEVMPKCLCGDDAGETGNIKWCRSIMLPTGPLAKTASQFLARLFHSPEESGCITCLEAPGMLFSADLGWAVTCHGHTLTSFRGHLPAWIPALGGDCSLPSCIVSSYEEPMGRKVRNREWFASQRLVSILHENFHIFEKKPKPHSPPFFKSPPDSTALEEVCILKKSILWN